MPVQAYTADQRGVKEVGASSDMRPRDNPWEPWESFQAEHQLLPTLLPLPALPVPHTHLCQASCVKEDQKTERMLLTFSGPHP